MELFWILVIVAIIQIAIIIVYKKYWFKERSKIIDVSGNDAPVLADFYDNLKWVEPNIDEILRYFNLMVSPSIIFITDDLDAIQKNYFRETEKNLPSYQGTTVYDCYIDLREMIGIPSYLILINDAETHFNVTKNVCSTEKYLASVISRDKYLELPSHLQDIINRRWLDIFNLNDDSLVNFGGSYAYLKTPIPGITLNQVQDYYRVNLLCDEDDYSELIKAWKTKLNLKID